MGDVSRAATPTTAAATPTTAAASGRDLAGIVRVLTCGSVDDGKSTLIGRLLWDASDLFEDQREALRRSGRRVLDGQHLDYSLLVDGLLAEREQGITIDIAWRYFDTAARRFTIIDSPGHEQYTRNMASGASHADVAVMLIDARHGIKRQTRRHAAILDLFGVRRVVLAINKMDLVDWSEARFREIDADFRSLLQGFRFDEAVAIPVAAVTGDNVARLSEVMGWYSGPTLLGQLDKPLSAVADTGVSFRMPVQSILRDGQDFRGLAGTVSAGQVAPGDSIIDVVSGREARIARIATMDGDLDRAYRGQAVALLLDRDIDVSRGAVLATAVKPPTAARSLDVRLVWLAETAFDVKTHYLLRTATDVVPVSRLAIAALLDLETMVAAPSSACAMNDIAVATIDLGRATALDTFAVAPETGSFVLVDFVTGATLAGGVVTAARADLPSELGVAAPGSAYVLTRAILTGGVCADIAGDATMSAEFARRAEAVAGILRAAGLRVDVQI